jgi:TRAP-type C4-dicarboxylate transport system permease small subunit
MNWIGMLIGVLVMFLGLAFLYGGMYWFAHKYSQTLPEDERESFWENFERNLLNHENKE